MRHDLNLIIGTSKVNGVGCHEHNSELARKQQELLFGDKTCCRILLGYSVPTDVSIQAPHHI